MSYPYPPNNQPGFNPATGNMGFTAPPMNSSAPPVGNPSSLPYSLDPTTASYQPNPATSSFQYPSNPPSSSIGNVYPPISTPYSTGSSPYPPNPASVGYPPNPASGGYPPNPASGGYPPNPASGGYPPNPASGGYPPNPASGGYPPNPASGGYPPNPASGANPASGGYPPNPTSGGYPPNPTSGGYPPNPTSGGYPPNPTSGSYPSNPASGGYPPNPASGGYPPNPASGDNPTAGGYPPITARTIGTYQATGPISSKTISSSYNSYSSNKEIVGTMWPYIERPTLRPVTSFDPSSDAAVLKKAMKGFGTDEKAIINLLGRRTSVERQQIKLKYQQSYGKDLEKDLKSELSGKFEDVIVALMTPLPTYLCNEIHKAIQGLGTNENTLIEILCSSDNKTLNEIKSAYRIAYKKPIEQELKGDTSGDFMRLLVSLATASRDERGDPSVAPSLAQALYKAGEKKMGTDESEFNRILCVYSYPVLRCTFEEYRKISGKSFDASIKSETSGCFQDGLLALYYCIQNRASFFAKELNGAMKGLGTNDNALIRIIVSRSEIDMGNIKDEYHKAYGKRLEDVITSETSGDYKKILLTLIQG